MPDEEIPFERCDQEVEPIDISPIVVDCSIPAPPKQIIECLPVPIVPQPALPRVVAPPCPKVLIGSRVFTVGADQGGPTMTVQRDDTGVPLPESPDPPSEDLCQWVYGIRLYTPAIIRNFPVKLLGDLHCGAGQVPAEVISRTPRYDGTTLNQGQQVMVDGKVVSGFIPKGETIRVSWRLEDEEELNNGANQQQSQVVNSLGEGVFSVDAVMTSDVLPLGVGTFTFKKDPGVPPIEREVFAPKETGGAPNGSEEKVIWNSQECRWELVPRVRRIRLKAELKGGQCAHQALGHIDDNNKFVAQVHGSRTVGHWKAEEWVYADYDKVISAWRPVHQGRTSVTLTASNDIPPGATGQATYEGSVKQKLKNNGAVMIKSGQKAVSAWNAAQCLWETDFCCATWIAIQMETPLKGESGENGIGSPADDNSVGDYEISPHRFRGYLFPQQQVFCYASQDPQYELGTSNPMLVAEGGGGCHAVDGTSVSDIPKGQKGIMNIPEMGSVEAYSRFGKTKASKTTGVVWNSAAKQWETWVQECKEEDDLGGY